MSNFNFPCHNGASDFPQLSLKLCSGPLPNSCVTLILHFLNLSLHHHQVSLPKIGSLPSTFQVLYCQPNKAPVSLARAQGLPLGHFPPSHSLCLSLFLLLSPRISFCCVLLFIYSKPFQNTSSDNRGSVSHKINAFTMPNKLYIKAFVLIHVIQY